MNTPSPSPPGSPSATRINYQGDTRTVLGVEYDRHSPSYRLTWDGDTEILQSVMGVDDRAELVPPEPTLISERHCVVGQRDTGGTPYMGFIHPGAEIVDRERIVGTHYLWSDGTATYEATS